MDMTTDEIFEKRAEIAHVLCARVKFIERHPGDETITITITPADMDNVSAYELLDMIRQITP